MRTKRIVVVSIIFDVLMFTVAKFGRIFPHLYAQNRGINAILIKEYITFVEISSV